jgi:nucleotide-binding universal stress UspA family protein
MRRTAHRSRSTAASFTMLGRRGENRRREVCEVGQGGPRGFCWLARGAYERACACTWRTVKAGRTCKQFIKVQEDRLGFKILVGYDGSEGAQAALREGLRLARQLSGRVIASYVVGGGVNGAGAAEIVSSPMRAVGERVLAQALMQARSAGVSVEPLILGGSAAEGLLGAARQHRADMIVVGACGRAGADGVPLGSTARDLVRGASQPVLVVPAVRRLRRAA